MMQGREIQSILHPPPSIGETTHINSLDTGTINHNPSPSLHSVTH